MKKILTTREAAAHCRFSYKKMTRLISTIPGAYQTTTVNGEKPKPNSQWFVPLDRLTDWHSRSKYAVGSAKRKELEKGWYCDARR